MTKEAVVNGEEQLIRIHGKLDKITEVLATTASGLDALKQDHERLYFKVERHCEETDTHVLQEKVESLIKELKGNGQPGFITKTYERLNALDNWKWKVVGISIGVSTVVGAVVTILRTRK